MTKDYSSRGLSMSSKGDQRWSCQSPQQLGLRTYSRFQQRYTLALGHVDCAPTHGDECYSWIKGFEYMVRTISNELFSLLSESEGM